MGLVRYCDDCGGKITGGYWNHVMRYCGTYEEQKKNLKGDWLGEELCKKCAKKVKMTRRALKL